uniref:Trichohyalin-plectin-homology domain-containing protein n=1 Tax=Chlamydomonas euryale TaxID=1486919 RepID=A0A7R9YSI7_9CHLO|mmetsp:Transcript_18682/g.55718  ORF Transcript_18682/g.55718 Transcript_18682/m.55718 type:complete len:495 (+) Transcript_18682:279-1763(+)
MASRGRPATGQLASAPPTPGTAGKSPATALGVTGGRIGTAAATPGSKPGTGRIRTTAGTPGGGGADNDALTKKIILKMRVRFGDAAADLAGQELISQEVSAFMNVWKSGATLREEDLSVLEAKIRQRLTGGTPRLMTMTMEKRAQVDGDEWAKMYQYQIAQGKIKEAREREALLKRQAEMRSTLDSHIRMQEAEKQRLRDADRDYHQQQCEKLKSLDEAQRAKEELQASIIKKLGEERVAQVREKEQRIARARAKIAAEEAEMAARMAYEAKTELEKEERMRRENKESLERFLKGNEENKALRALEKERVNAENEYYKEAWQAQLDKQEAQRKALLDKNRVRQTLQEIAASGREESKRWLPQEIIDKQYREREDARAKEEEERIARVKAGAKAAYQSLAEQVKEREEAKRLDKTRDLQAARMVLDRVQREQDAEAERRRLAEAEKLKFKTELEAQMKDNAQRRRVAPMTSIERLINHKMLDEVHDWQSTGKVVV